MNFCLLRFIHRYKMGSILSNQSSAESQDTSSNSYYYYPPKNGRYFGSSFIMGGDKFEMSQPESYLFGENYDLNYLGGKPSPFPYTAPLPNEPMQMLRSFINIRKETLKLINSSSESKNSHYTIEFVLDSEVNCAITIYFLCKEDLSTNGLKYIPKDPNFCSETYHFKAGIGQLFSKSSVIFNPQNYNASDLFYQIIDEKGEFNASALYPAVIQCVAEEGDDPKQSHTLIATVEKVYDNVFSLKPLKQKIFVDGLSYLLQEIYGIENKSNKQEKTYDDESDNSFECVICMSDLRDTLILPCRHLCLCNGCANSLRYQANNCPICRVPFRALLKIKAIKTSTNNQNSQIILPESSNEVIPVGFETIPLVEALNGINPQLSSITLKQSLESRPEEDSKELETHEQNSVIEDDAKNSDSISLPNDINNTTESATEKNSGDFKNLDEETVSFNMKNSVSVSSSSSGNVENMQEKTRLLTAQKNKPISIEQSESNSKTSQQYQCDQSLTVNIQLNEEPVASDCNTIDKANNDLDTTQID